VTFDVGLYLYFPTLERWPVEGHGSPPECLVPHVPLETLIDYVRALCPAAKQEEIRLHLAVCTACCGTAARVAQLTAVGDIADLPAEPPEDVVDAAIALFHTLPTRRNVLPELGQLVFDSALDFAPESAVAGTRFLRFATPGDVDVELLVTECGACVSVSGQVTERTTGGPLQSAVSAHRESGVRAIASAHSNEIGEFWLSYDRPAAAMFRFVIAGVLAPLRVHLTAEAVI
jgi:hypothetical protein